MAPESTRNLQSLRNRTAVESQINPPPDSRSIKLSDQNTDVLPPNTFWNTSKILGIQYTMFFQHYRDTLCWRICHDWHVDPSRSGYTLTLTECTLQLGVYTPKPLCYHSHRSVHSNHTPNIIGVHWDATPWTWLNYSPIEIHSNATSSALQVECTLHCHSHNLVFVHIHSNTTPWT